MNEKIKELLTKLKEKNIGDYNKVNEIISFLQSERLKFIGNSLRSTLGRSSSIVDEKRIISGVKELNKFADTYQVDLKIPEDFESIEKYLRISILEDIGKEFEKQSN